MQSNVLATGLGGLSLSRMAVKSGCLGECGDCGRIRFKQLHGARMPKAFVFISFSQMIHRHCEDSASLDVL
jgi:hypothetical protein